MVQQDKINSPDLPEPVQRLLTKEEKLNRQWKLFVVMITFVAIYSVLHKLLIPVTLNFTSLQGSPYTKIDFWFFHPVILAFYIQRVRRNDSVLSFLCGIAILYGVYEIYETIEGRNTGWLAFSRLLSSIPLSVACGYLMTQTRFGGSFKAAWCGVFALALWIVAHEISFFPKELTKASQTSPYIIQREIPKGEQPVCGAQEVNLKPGMGNKGVREIKISSCGFSPAVLNLDEGGLEVTNERSEAVNLHLVSTETGKPKTVWNLSVPANSKIQSRGVKLSSQAIGMLYSDSAPEAGLVAIQSSQQMNSWTLKRKPIRLEKKP